jgi:hypothetical protein
MISMLMTKIAPPPGAQAVAGLRARARAARRIALIALTGSIALLCAAQLLAERAATKQEALPAAGLALAVFLGALPSLVITQAIWAARARETRRREHELYAAPAASPLRPLGRLAMACGWALVVLLGGALPRLFADAGRHALAAVLAGAVTVAGIAACSVAGVCSCLWWARDARGMPMRASRSGGSPGDPWDPGPGARRRRGAVLRTGAAVAVAALLGARAHFWTLPTPMIYALLVATFACIVVTDE